MVTNSRDEPIKPLRGNSSTSGILKTSLFSSHKSARHPAHYQVASGYLAKTPSYFLKSNPRSSLLSLPSSLPPPPSPSFLRPSLSPPRRAASGPSTRSGHEDASSTVFATRTPLEKLDGGEELTLACSRNLLVPPCPPSTVCVHGCLVRRHVIQWLTMFV